MHIVYICISVLMNYDCTTHPILHFITITTKFLSKHCIKRVLDTEMNAYHCFNFTEKRSYEVWTLSNQKMSKFHFDLSLKISQGEVHDYSGDVQKLSGEVPHLPSKSGHEQGWRGGGGRLQGQLYIQLNHQPFQKLYNSHSPLNQSNQSHFFWIAVMNENIM